MSNIKKKEITPKYICEVDIDSILSEVIENKMKRDMLTEDAKIQFREKDRPFKGCTIYVYNNEGDNIPHFHIKNKESSNKFFHCCICLLENKYFTHGSAHDELTSKQRKILVDVLNLSSSIDNKISNYKYLVNGWNQGKENMHKIDIENCVMPDYISMKESRH